MTTQVTVSNTGHKNITVSREYVVEAGLGTSTKTERLGVLRPREVDVFNVWKEVSLVITETYE